MGTRNTFLRCIPRNRCGSSTSTWCHVLSGASTGTGHCRGDRCDPVCAAHAVVQKAFLVGEEHHQRSDQCVGRHDKDDHLGEPAG